MGSPQSSGLRRQLSPEFCLNRSPPVFSLRSAGQWTPAQQTHLFSGTAPPCSAIPVTSVEQVNVGKCLGFFEGGPSTPPGQIIPGIGPLLTSAQPTIFTQAQPWYHNLSPIYHQEPVVSYVPQHIIRPTLSQSLASNQTPSSVNRPISGNSQSHLVSAPSSNHKVQNQKRQHYMETDEDSPTPESKTQQNPIENLSYSSSQTLQIIFSADDLKHRKKRQNITPTTQNLTTLDLVNVPLTLSIPIPVENQSQKMRRFKSARKRAIPTSQISLIPLHMPQQEVLNQVISQPNPLPELAAEPTEYQAMEPEFRQNQGKLDEEKLEEASVEAARQPRRKT